MFSYHFIEHCTRFPIQLNKSRKIKACRFKCRKYNCLVIGSITVINGITKYILELIGWFITVAEFKVVSMGKGNPGAKYP